MNVSCKCLNRTGCLVGQLPHGPALEHCVLVLLGRRRDADWVQARCAFRAAVRYARERLPMPRAGIANGRSGKGADSLGVICHRYDASKTHELRLLVLVWVTVASVQQLCRRLEREYERLPRHSEAMVREMSRDRTDDPASDSDPGRRRWQAAAHPT